MAPLESVTLKYFNGRGRAETCRWLLIQAGVKYVDYRFKDGEWATAKETSPTLMCPFAEIDGKVIASSTAIAHYVAKSYDMMGANDWEAAEVMMCIDLLGDTISAKVKYMFNKNEEEKETMRKAYLENALPRLLKFINLRLEGGKQWLVGNKISLGDIAVAQYLHDENDTDAKAIIAKDGVATGLTTKITEQPGIKDWIEKRPETNF